MSFNGLLISSYIVKRKEDSKVRGRIMRMNKLINVFVWEGAVWLGPALQKHIVDIYNVVLLIIIMTTKTAYR